MKKNPDFKYVSTLSDLNKYLPVCNSYTDTYLCFETFACVFLLKIMFGTPKTCIYYELPPETQRGKIITTKIQNYNTTIFLSDTNNTILDRISRGIEWKKL
jgi:hypothetical protein